MTADDLVFEAAAIRALSARVLDATDIGTRAIEYATRNWPVIPLRGKVPAIPSPHPRGVRCKGDCGLPGHGVLDATTELGAVISWWAGDYGGCNIGVRVPSAMIVLDIDVWKGGGESWAKLEREHGTFPHCLTTLSGHGDGSRHLFMRRPGNRLSTAKLGPGIDLRTHGNYVVAPPSVHPDTGKRYVRVDGPVIEPPRWLVDLLTVDPPRLSRPMNRRQFDGPSVIDDYNDKMSWADVLMPHGWALHWQDIDPNADGARWLHPAATSKCSATISGGRLYCYSTSTVLDVTVAHAEKHGYSKFDAYAAFAHRGDFKAAARQLRSQQGGNG